ncbi:hypothetical protein BDN67DRAFT_573933 [Paxillus ammoniavirescens]|nr:hypothetical protein BDN67DRAFT_573933 [Paxillus ammoniavirescens]
MEIDGGVTINIGPYLMLSLSVSLKRLDLVYVPKVCWVTSNDQHECVVVPFIVQTFKASSALQNLPLQPHTPPSANVTLKQSTPSLSCNAQTSIILAARNAPSSGPRAAAFVLVSPGRRVVGDAMTHSYRAIERTRTHNTVNIPRSTETYPTHEVSGRFLLWTFALVWQFIWQCRICYFRSSKRML